MRTMLRGAVGALGLATALVATGPVRAQAPIEKALPPSTIALLKVESVAGLRQAFGQSQAGQLLADPGMKPLKDKLAELLEQPNQATQQAVGLTIPELLDLPQGPLAVAVIARDDEKVPVALLVSADAGENADKMNDVLTRATAEAEKAGAKVATEEFGGATLHVIQAKDEDAPPLIWARQGSIFRIGTDAQSVKDLMTNAGGREPSLASNENFGEVLERVGRDAQVTWFVDLAQVVALATRAAEEGQGNAQQIAAQMQILGLNSLKAMGGSLAFNVGEFDSLGKIYVYAPGEAQGIFKLFPMPATNLKPQPWVPAGVASYQSISWDLDAAWDGLNQLVDQFAPGALDQAQKALAGPDGPGIDLKRDVFGPLGDRITIVSDFKKPIKEDSQRILLAVALDDSKAFQETLNKVFKAANYEPKKRTFQGATIYDFEIPDELTEQAGIPGPISMTIAKDALYVSTEPSILEQVLRPGGPSLADSPEFQKLAQIYPTAASTLSYQRPEEQVRLLYDMVKSGQLQEAIKQATANAQDAPDVDKVLDPKLLPEFSVIEKYLAPGGGFGVLDQSGATFTQFTTKKANP
jgi:hypothetical protein